MRLVVSMCTVDRGPHTYLGGTVRDLLSKGVPASAIHLFPTSPDVAWLDRELGSLAICRHVPEQPCHRNANGLRQITVLDEVDADWLVMLEDDVRVCDDFLGSVTRWLSDHARPDVGFYRLLTLGLSRQDPTFGSPRGQAGPGAQLWSNWEVIGAQAVAIRADHAREFAAWGMSNREHFRPSMAPFQTRREDGFDKMLGYWARDTRPGSFHLAANPNLVLHVGETSSLHRRGIRNDIRFSARSYVGAGQGVAS